jgi:uncharacterized membrane protein YcaP (DUF421 family)
MGKKQIAQLDFVDYVIGISIGSIAAQMTISKDPPYYYFLIAISVFTIFDLLLSLSAENHISQKNRYRRSVDFNRERQNHI